MMENELIVHWSLVGVPKYFKTRSPLIILGEHNKRTRLFFVEKIPTYFTSEHQPPMLCSQKWLHQVLPAAAAALVRKHVV